MLVSRCCVNAWFALWLVTRARQWSDVFDIGAIYALLDGALGLATGLLLMEQGSSDSSFVLPTMTVGDAILRLGAGVAIRTLPGLTGFPITLLVFFAVIAVWEVSLGATLVVSWFVAAERAVKRGGVNRRKRALLGPPAFAGFVALLFAGYAFLAGPPSTADALRTVAALAAGALAIVFGAAALRASDASRHRLREAPDSPSQT